MDKAKRRITIRVTRAERIRRKIIGTAERPRLSVRRSLKHIYAQLVDDSNQKTIVQVGSSSKNFSSAMASAKDKNKRSAAKVVGEMIAEKAKEKGITKVVFDRKGYAYHGRVRALAEGARGKGLVF
jgi:large subunit ribosomal protein L18